MFPISDFDFRPCGGKPDPRFNPAPRRIELTPEQRAMFQRQAVEKPKAQARPTRPAAPVITGVDEMAKKVDLPEELVRSIYQRYVAGESLADIDMPCSMQTMINRFRKHRLEYPLPVPGKKMGGRSLVETPDVPAWQRDRDQGKTIREIAQTYGVSTSTVCKYTTGAPLSKGKQPKKPAATKVVTRPAAPQMDDPAPESRKLKLTKSADPSTLVDAPDVLQPPPPDEEFVSPEQLAQLVKERVKDLHQQAPGGMVIAAEPIMLARKQYSVPRILEAGTLFEVTNPHAAAKLVEGLVARLNEVPGVQAYFEWRAEGQTGQPLAR